jgi:hypothetical protein
VPTMHRGSMPAARRDRLLKRDGLPPGPHPNYELDHIVPVCLGGSDDDANIKVQPRRSIEPIWNAERKDILENFLCQMVRNGVIGQFTAQHEIATDWRASYLKYFKN